MPHARGFEAELGDDALGRQVRGIDQGHDLGQAALAERMVEAGARRLGREAPVPDVAPEAVGEFDVHRLRHRAEDDIAQIVVGPVAREHAPVPEADAEIGADALAHPPFLLDWVRKSAIADIAADLRIGVHPQDRRHLREAALAQQKPFGGERRQRHGGLRAAFAAAAARR